MALAGCRVADIPPRQPWAKTNPGPTPQRNLTRACVADFSPKTNYFPDQARVQFAGQFTVSYHGHYKRLLFQPNVRTQEQEEYLLVQCGTPVPPHSSRTRVVTVPVQRFVLANTAFGSAIVRMDLLPELVGIPSVNAISHPAIADAYQQGRVKEVGTGPHSSVELAIATEAQLFFTFYSAWPNYNTHPKLWEAGIQGIPTADHFERHPLGRTEWIKFIALFFNREREANAIFEPAARNYQALRDRTASVTHRPEVLVGWPSGRDIWNLNGARNFFATFIHDAGGRYFWQDDLALSLVPANYETVFDQQRAAPVFISRSYSAQTRKAFTQKYPSMSHFPSFQANRVWSPDKGTQLHRRPPWQDQSLDYPERVLADLIYALHPELIPHHAPHYLRPVD